MIAIYVIVLFSMILAGIGSMLVATVTAGFTRDNFTSVHEEIFGLDLTSLGLL